MANFITRLFGATAVARVQPLVLQSGDEMKRPTVKELEEEVATPSMTGVRRAWSPDSMVDGLTPDKLSALLRAANQGDMDGILTLAEEMEERDPHYASVLQTRKLAVAGLDRQLTWADGDEDHPQADEIHKACAQLIAAPEFEKLIWGALDALAKPFAVIETIWKATAEEWKPVDYRPRDQRWFQFDKETGAELRLKETGEPDGLPLEPHKFLVMIQNHKSGLPARGGLARLVAFSFVCKLYGIKDWMAYAEIFGIPLRLGKYGAGASADDVEVLKRAVFGLGSDAAAVIPSSMTVEFPNLGAAGGAELFKMLVEFFDNQVSKAVVGQTGSADMQKGGGYAQSKVQENVRSDLTKADAKWVGSSVTAGPLTHYVFFKFGPGAPVPNLNLVVEENEDVTVLSQALERLVPLGLEVDQTEIRKKLKLSEPSAGAKLLTPPKPAGAPGGPPPEGGSSLRPPARDPEPADATAKARDQQAVALAQVETIFAAARARRDQAEAQLTEIQLAALDGWERDWGPEVSRVLALAADAESYETFAAGLAKLAGDLAAPAGARSLAGAMFQASVIGEAQTRPPKRLGAG